LKWSLIVLFLLYTYRQWSVSYQLKQENYNLKFKQRIILLTLGNDYLVLDILLWIW
jgi:hypothetical protein